MNKKIFILLASTVLANSLYSAEDEFEDEFSSELAAISSSNDQTDENIRVASRAFSSLSLSAESPDHLERFKLRKKEKESGRFSGGTTSIEQQEKQEKRKERIKRSAEIHAERTAGNIITKKEDCSLHRKRSASEPIMSKRPSGTPTRRKNPSAPATLGSASLFLIKETSMEEEEK